ncbi:hypothetical protein PC114_g13809 [Phytophthora cactorum]|nr:hypothetical protein PC114_g13809 [Phytophthora cactorum]
MMADFLGGGGGQQSWSGHTRRPSVRPKRVHPPPHYAKEAVGARTRDRLRAFGRRIEGPGVTAEESMCWWDELKRDSVRETLLTTGEQMTRTRRSLSQKLRWLVSGTDTSGSNPGCHC